MALICSYLALYTWLASINITYLKFIISACDLSLPIAILLAMCVIAHTCTVAS